MKVYFDISALGSSVQDPRARTGVARYIESLLPELITAGPVSIKLCAARSPLSCMQSRVLAGQGGLVPGSTVSLPENPFLRGYIKAQEPLYQALSGSAVARKLLGVINRPGNSLFRNAVPRGILDADLFHGTFFPISNDWTGITKVLTIFDLIPVKFPQFFDKRMIGLMNQVYRSAEHCDQLVAISHSTKSDLCEHTGISPERVTVTPLAAADSFRPCHDADLIGHIREHYAIPRGQYLLSLCTLEPRKNILQTIRTFVALVKQQRLDDLGLVLVGTKGWNFDHIFEAIKGAGNLRDRIIVTGFVPDDHLAPLYSGALAFVYPSFYEGFGLPPLEAMQCGTPVVTSNTSSLPEVVGQAGIMIDPEDGEALGQAMLNLYQSAELREQLKEAGLARAANFTWSRCADLTIEAYRAAIDR